ncbi:MAG: hypothetical protein V8T01_08360 [Oscillospiraceae bacterium]
MKKRTITLIVLLAILVILAALVCIGLVKSAEAHDAVYADYDAAVSAVEGAALTVIENGSTVGTYSLAISASATPRSPPPPRPIPPSTAWTPTPSPTAPSRPASNISAPPANLQPVEIVADGLDASEVLSDLHASARTPSTDAHVEFKLRSIPDRPGDTGSEIDDEAVTAALLATLSAEALPDLRGTSAEPQTAALVIDETLYIKPEITMDTVEYDPLALLAADLSGQTLDVHIDGQTRGLSETALSQLLSASADGNLSVDSDALALSSKMGRRL